MACIHVQKDVVAQHGHLMYYGFPPKAILRKKRAELTIGHHCAILPRGTSLTLSLDRFFTYLVTIP